MTSWLLQKIKKKLRWKWPSVINTLKLLSYKMLQNLITRNGTWKKIAKTVKVYFQNQDVSFDNTSTPMGLMRCGTGGGMSSTLLKVKGILRHVPLRHCLQNPWTDVCLEGWGMCTTVTLVSPPPRYRGISLHSHRYHVLLSYTEIIYFTITKKSISHNCCSSKRSLSAVSVLCG